MNRWISAFLFAVCIAAMPSIVFAQEDGDEKQLFAKPKKDWEWDDDKRFEFLIERLASLEASLDAVERAIAKASGKRGTKQGAARRADANNSMMDRKGGGPMKWNEFYGTTAEKFFYHPTDPNTTYHTNTTLQQMGKNEDDKAGNGVPASQSLPVHQRPPQFDYIYRANRDAKDKAEQDAIALSGQIEELNRRRTQLEDEQAELWCLLAFRAIQRQNIPKRPMLRFALVPAGTAPSDIQRFEALTAASKFLAAALVVIDDAESDQAKTLAGIKKVIGPARSRFDDALINLTTLENDAASKKKKLGQFVALAQLLDDTASNLSESYEAAIDGNRFKDEARKDRFRGLLQRSLVEYAQIILALDELTTGMRKEWEITIDTKTPLGSVGTPRAMVSSSGSAPAQQRSVASTNTAPTPARNARAEWRSLFDGASLGGWKKTPFGGEGEVSVEDGSILIDRGSKMSGITWTKDIPKQDYEIELDALRVDGKDFFCGITFPVGDDLCSFIVGGWGGGCVGLSNIDEKDAAHNDTTSYKQFESGRWYKIRLSVTSESISCWIDGERVVNQAINGKTVSIRNEMIESTPLGISSFLTVSRVKNIRWRPVGR